jgi:hypothetical protein
MRVIALRIAPAHMRDWSCNTCGVSGPASSFAELSIGTRSSTNSTRFCRACLAMFIAEVKRFEERVAQSEVVP